jgi:hypothetical protein
VPKTTPFLTSNHYFVCGLCIGTLVTFPLFFSIRFFFQVSPFRAATGRWISFSAAQFAEEKAAESEAPTEPVPEADEAPVEEAEVETEEVDPAVELALKDVEESDDMPGSGPREMKKPDRIVWKKAVPFTHVLKKRSEMYEYRRAYERIYDRLQVRVTRIIQHVFEF